jgi:hypothetical protein
MSAQTVTVQDTRGSIIGAVYLAIWGFLLVVFVLGIFRFFRLASDVRSILELLLAEAEARDTD